MLTATRFLPRRRVPAVLYLLFAFLLLSGLTPYATAAPCDLKSGYSFVRHDLTESYCELCSYGYVTVVITNPYSYTDAVDPIDPDIPGAQMSSLELREDLGSSGLEFDSSAPDSVTYQVDGGASQVGGDPTISGSTLIFTSAQIADFALLESHSSASQVNEIVIRFAVRRSSDAEGLVSANRTIEAELSFSTDSACSDSPQTDQDTLPLREPIPEVTKTGWNYDAGQRQGTATDPLYGMNNDDVVWRVQIDNSGLAGLQDLRFDDLMQSDSVDINYICATEAAANSIAASNGSASVSGCQSAANNINDFVVTDPFGNMGLSVDNHEVDIDAGGSASVYLVGKIASDGSCVTSRTNSVSDVQWGCEAQTPAGGISATSTGLTAGDDATFYSRYNDTDHSILTVERYLTGTNTSQPVGSNGMMTIIIRNNSAGSVKMIDLVDALPAEYVADNTFDPELVVTPAYGVDYDGLVDTLTWTNRDNLDLLANTAPAFTLRSSTVHSEYADQEHMLRQGDVAVIRFRVVLINSAYYDRSANLDVNPEEFSVTTTDPEGVPDLLNELTVDFDVFCISQGSSGHYQLVLEGNGDDSLTENTIPADPEDLDVAVDGDVFILTNDRTQALTLPINITNNGGHDAADYHIFVALGRTMEIESAPADCAPISLNSSTDQPDPWQVWTLPTTLPGDASVYECTSSDVIAPGATVTYNFDVIKSDDVADIAADDLSLRSDVVGEITLSDGTLLTVPSPIARTDSVTDRANNYSLDATWARVIGFNLLKSQVGTCNENNPPSYGSSGYEEIQIGEECSYRIETGGWFGFDTPGFAYIAVQNIDVVDEVPDGQAYISNSDYRDESTSLISGVSLSPGGLSALTEGWFDWRFNVPDGDRIEVADEWFIIETTTRLLNKEIDERLDPNYHAVDSYNVLSSTFDATFSNLNTGLVEQYSLGPSTVGYPIEDVRRVDMRVTEPLLTVVKEVCNETLYGVGTACSNFSTLVYDGDAYTSYIYRLTVTNEETADGYQRAPAYDVTVIDTLDPTDLAYIKPLSTDGLDNDGDASNDGADSGGEGSISDNTTENGNPAVITFAYDHSSALERIDPGQSVELYYRVDFDDDVAPLQTLTNEAYATYDSLEGDSGSQTVSPQLNSTLGGARFYSSDVARASVTILPVISMPKTITDLAESTAVVSPATQTVVVGEELEYQLNTLLPVARLEDFIISDELPAGLRCSEAPDIDLDAAPYSAAGFTPGGVITPTCTDSLVEWDFGTQTLTLGNGSDRYDMAISFIAQVINSSLTNDGDLLSNGDPATAVTVRYIDEDGTLVTYNYGQIDVEVTEPLIELSQSFGVAETDAGDHVEVTVTATNIGTSTAYNLRVLAPLSASDLSYVSASVGGTNPPDQVDIATLGADQPIFSWSLPNGIAVGDSVSFTFDLEVAADVQPHQLLETTLQADWTSLAAQTTSLNSGGSIDVDGSTNGMRNGALPNAGDAVNDYETTATAEMTVALPAIVKTDEDTALVPTIGAHKQFSVVISLPEGVTQNVSISDSLDAAGISYLLADTVTYPIIYSFSGIASINGVAVTESSFIAVPSDGASSTVTWDIGTVTTAVEDDSSSSLVTPSITINYYARVNNDLVTDAGDQLQNEAELSYLNIETGSDETLSSATAAVVVSEPSLSLTKTLSNITNPSAPPVIGDTLEYQLILVNTGSTNSTAWDINIVDTLPAGLELVDAATFTPTATISGGAVAGFTATPDGAPAGPLTWGRDHGDESLDLPAGQVLVITYRASVTWIDPIDPIENSVIADWTSLDGVWNYERNGAGCPSITLPDDYCVGPVTSSTVGIAPQLLFQKTVSNDSTGTDPAVTARPGDVLRYRLQITSITSADATYSIADEIDSLNASSRFVPGSLTMTAAAGVSADPTGGSAGTGQIDIATRTLTGGSSETFEFTVQLLPVIADGSEVYNQADISLVGYTDSLSDDPNISGTEDPTRTLIVSAPQWQIEKTAEDLTGAPSVLFAGDQIRYTITVKNVGTEDAVDATLRDAIPANTSYVAGSTTLNGAAVADIGGVSALDAGLLIYAPEDTTAGNMRADSDGDADNVATITFEVVVDTTVSPATVISNQAYLDGTGEGSGAFVGQPSDDPTTATDSDATELVVSGIGFEKSVYNVTQSSGGATAVPGDILRYTLTLTNLGSEDLSALSVGDELESLHIGEPLYFTPATLTLIALPSGADGSTSSATGGAKGTGLVEVTGIDISAGSSVDIVFTIQLASVITSGTQVLNQAQAGADGINFILSDSDDSSLTGDQDPTETLISSEPVLEVSKTSTYLEGDTSVLMAGEQLRYTISIRNVGNENAVDAALQDYTPSNTSYVPGSVTLNGSPVADAAGGTNPLHDGIAINSPDTTTSGLLIADSDTTANNLAVVTFDVLVDADALDGLIIENQGFVQASGDGSGAQPEQPSDDPDTPEVDDPTRDVVGNLPLLYAHKTVALAVDNLSADIVDPGDTLLYTLTITNSGATEANVVVLTDAVPNDTSYVADSITLNGVSLGSDGGVSPLIGGLTLESADGPGTGIISAGESAVVTFEVQVDAGVATGTLITNQGTLSCDELADLLTDSDGLPGNGYQETVIAVGDVQLLQIVKDVAVTDGGSAEPGSELTYTISVRNIGTLAATLVSVEDDLSAPLGDQINYISGSATLNGLAAGVSYVANVLRADYSAIYGDLGPGSSFTVRFNAQIDSALAYGTTITNIAEVQWSNPDESPAEASVSIDVGGTPGAAALSGSVWHDDDFDRSFSGAEAAQSGWTVDLYLDGIWLTSTTTADDGSYSLSGLVSSDALSGLYELRFSAPGAGSETAMLGTADSAYTDGLQSITDISVSENSYAQNLNLPLTPNGVVYDSITRGAVSGATLTMVNAVSGVALPTTCFDDSTQQGQVTTSNGFYKFDLNFTQGSCPAGGDYIIEVEAPADDYLATPSLIIPPTSDSSTAAYSVPICPADAIPTTAAYCEAIPSPTAPSTSVAAGSSGTIYYQHLNYNDGFVPGDSQIFNNSIPIDPVLSSAVALTKVAEITSVSKGDLVPYTITLTNIFNADLEDIRIVDTFPAGFKYVAGSALVDGVSSEPETSGRTLTWNDLELDTDDALTIRLLLIVGSGVGEGDYVNRARAYNTVLGTSISGQAQATVRVTPDPDFDCTDIIGKVYDDTNFNGYQDREETGLSGVKVVTARGLIATTDSHGRYHFTCAVVPDEDRGSNFIMKLDERSLPSGFRMISENPRVQRATRGKMMRFNFGATLHRVVAIDIADAAFEPESTILRLQWRDKFDQLLEVLEQQPSLLRLSYLGDVESSGLVKKRLKIFKKEMEKRWNNKPRDYRLAIEEEIFWRRGAPLKK